jgi:hypothetical protein
VEALFYCLGSTELAGCHLEGLMKKESDRSTFRFCLVIEVNVWINLTNFLLASPFGASVGPWKVRMAP